MEKKLIAIFLTVSMIFMNCGNITDAKGAITSGKERSISESFSESVKCVEKTTYNSQAVTDVKTMWLSGDVNQKGIENPYEGYSAYGDFEYYYNRSWNIARIWKYIGKGGTVYIPDTIEGYTVTGISANAFQNNVDVTSVILPSGLNVIYSYAFRGCKNLTFVTFSAPTNGKLEIRSDAFEGCTALTSVNIPNGDYSINLIGNPFFGCKNLTSVTLGNSVTIDTMHIGDFFYGCEKLNYITVDAENMSYSSYEGVMFNKDRTKLLLCPNGIEGDYNIPYGVKTIGECAFNFSELTSIHIPSTISNIEKGSLTNCNNMSDIYYDGTQEDWKKITIGENNFSLDNATLHFASEAIPPIGDVPSRVTFKSINLSHTAVGTPSGTLSFSGTIYLKDGTTAADSEWAKIMNSIIWTSSNPAVADNITVKRPAGMGETAYSTFIVSVQAKAEGTAVITGTLPDGMKASCAVTVTDEGEEDREDSGETVIHSYIIQRVSRYTSDDIYEGFDKINKSDCSEEERYQKYYDLFVDYGFKNVKEGISYLSNTTAERYAYLMLTTDDCFIASQFVHELNNTSRGKAMRTALIVDGLLFSSEWKTWTNPLILASSNGELPGVKKYKEMLYDYMKVQSQKIECMNYAKTITDLTDKVTDVTKAQILKEVNDVHDSMKYWEILGKYSDVLFTFDEDGETVKEYTIDEGSGFGKFAKAEGYASTGISIISTTLEDVMGFIQLDSKLRAYQENKDFLNEIIRSADDLPSELRYAAYLVREEMEAGAGANIKDLALDIMNLTLKISKLTKDMFTNVLKEHGIRAPGALTNFLTQVDVGVWFSNRIMNMGSVVKKEVYVEGYTYLAEHFTKLLEQNKEAFLNNRTEENAWNFYYTYNTLYQLRQKGEESYLAMCNVEGLAAGLAKKGINYELKEKGVNSILGVLEERCQFTLPEGMEIPKSVSYHSKAVVRCPVDIEVLDIRGNSIVKLLDRVETDVINQYGRFAVIYDSYTGDYVKVICLNSAENVSIQIRGIDKGLVNMELAQAQDLGNKIYAFNNVPVNRGTVIETTVNKIIEQKTYDVDVDGDGIIDEKGIVNVKQDSYCPVEYVSLDKSILMLNKGESDILKVTVSPLNATEQRVSWMSADSSVATVVDGKVTAIAEGSTTIYCTALAAKDIVASCKIEVTSLAPTQEPTAIPTQTPDTVPTEVPGSTPEPAEEPDDTEIDIAEAAEVTLGEDSYTYNGKPREPEAIVQTELEYLEEDVDYIVSYKNNTNVGVASVIVTGLGKYTGQITRTFKIFPKGTSLSGKLKAISKGFVVKWKKQTKCTSGYQVQYSTSKKFAKRATVTKTVKKKSVSKLAVRKLKAKKKYYVRIRTYRIARGRKYYSDWSKKRSIKTKK